MQLNVHVPKDREDLIRALDEAVRELDRPKSELVLDAVEQYLRDLHRRRRARRAVEIPTFDLRAGPGLRRADLYDERVC
jgi:hypothetical protein